MKVEEIRLLFDYNYWATGRILDTAAKAGPRLYTASGKLSHGGLRETLVHLVSAEWIWLQRVKEGVSPTEMLDPKDYPTLDALRKRWVEEEATMRAYLRGLKDADLERVVHYQDRQGNSFALALWKILLHVVNHGTLTRSEAAVLLTQKGFSPGDLDLRMYLILTEESGFA
jgi:uncharacterized damage-inducible protein DinB